MVGFEGYSIDPLLREYILEWGVGGVIIFGRNIHDAAQVGELCSDLQRLRKEISDLPLLIAVDQEGGAIARFRDGPVLFPGNMALGVGGTEEDAYLQGRIVGRELRKLGINMNLAPVLDLYSPPGNPSLGIRSLGSDPRLVAALGRSLIKGQQEEGVIATAKHFPGKGRARLDSHEDLPRIDTPARELESRDIIPFQAAIEEGVRAVMTSHAAYPGLDGEDDLPATLSGEVIGRLLRKELGFKGLVVTDDLGMGAIGKNYPPGEAAVRALKAGADILLFCHSRQDRQEARLALEAEAISEKEIGRRIEESRKRVRRAKEELRSSAPPEGGTVPGGEATADRIARKAITVLKDRGDALPLKKGGRALLIWFRPEKTVEVEDEFEAQWRLDTFLRGEGVEVETSTLSLSPSSEEAAACLRKVEGEERVIIASYDGWRFPEEGKLIEAILECHPSAILAVLKDPRDGYFFSGAGTVVLTFGFTPDSLKALAETIAGKYRPRRRATGLGGMSGQ